MRSSLAFEKSREVQKNNPTPKDFVRPSLRLAELDNFINIIRLYRATSSAIEMLTQEQLEKKYLLLKEKSDLKTAQNGQRSI